MSGMVPRAEIAVLSGLQFASSDFRDFRAHGPRMRIDDLSAPSGRFAARATAAITTDDYRPGREDFFLSPTLHSLRFLPYPLMAARARQKPPLPQGLSPSMLLPCRTPHREPAPPRSVILPRPPLRYMAPRHLRPPCWLWVASPLGRAEEQPPPLAPSHLLLRMASGPAGPLVLPLDVLSPLRESHGRDRLCPSLRPPILPPRLPRWYPSRQAATAPTLWDPLFEGFYPP